MLSSFPISLARIPDTGSLGGLSKGHFGKETAMASWAAEEFEAAALGERVGLLESQRWMWNRMG